jgi:hypothetical protein
MRLTRQLAVAFVAFGAAVAGASSAQAWTWASSSNPIVMTGGGGYGSIAGVDYNTLVLRSTLKDTVLDGQRVYVHGYGNYTCDFVFESGRRTDGGSSYAAMADRYWDSCYPYGVGQYQYLIELCRDKPLAADPCSEDKRGWHGLN